MDHCPKCGFNTGAFGRVHRCVPKSRGVAEAAASIPALQQGLVSCSGDSAAPVREIMEPSRVEPAPRDANTYKYRDPEKRRAQVAAYMRAYRARKRNGGSSSTAER